MNQIVITLTFFYSDFFFLDYLVFKKFSQIFRIVKIYVITKNINQLMFMDIIKIFAKR